MFGVKEAKVACRMLGFTGGELMYDVDYGTGTIAMDNVNCAGTETDLWDCAHNEWGVNDCYHSEDVAIVCG